jgi:hypothetical protein
MDLLPLVQGKLLKETPNPKNMKKFTFYFGFRLSVWKTYRSNYISALGRGG